MLATFEVFNKFAAKLTPTLVV